MFGVSVAQEGPWTKLKDLPFTVPLGAACEVLDNNLVVVAGNRNMSGVLPLDGAVLETEWTAVPLPITAGYYPRSAVIGNALQFLTFDQEQDDLPKMLVYSPPGNWSAFDLFTFNTTPGDGDLVNLDVPAFSSGAAATIQIEDNTTMLYCGGVNEFDDNFSDACTVIQLSADDIRITYLSQNFSLPAPLLHTCHGGDGN